ncbi:PREDICTED: uncharacterized protein LOC104788668 isoform X1 [Camelina sativa]|uniref:Uncharacterized protein LOC104788668 isoform X1 n=1 Tax=Camelina sativa TaxID=90675 RepID=A0ABM1RRX6_CAMSA|nr:PREDICTED: uncharacterized protein LOC104788668 isoform X2 [Camelina sativa]XP_019101764.1 PREDICTED: uncharacterized protein LOC104788668 isoform X1 [Camelina sativa]
MAETEILEPYQVSFLDLVRLLSRFQSPRDRKRFQCISRKVMSALGPTGPGLLCITGVLGSALLRRQLLPMARKLALLNPDKRVRILKEHHLGSDVSLKNPLRDVSSFAMQLNYERTFKSSPGKLWLHEAAATLDLQKKDDEFTNLGTAFKKLGFCMRELGLSIARICDREIGGGFLEDSLMDSCTAKARLIHYHSAADKCALRETAERRNQSGKRVSSKSRNGDGLNGSHFNLWQQWHYDYGIFTVLTDPMFLSSYSSYQECTLMGSHSYLQIYHPSKNKLYMVKTPQDSFIVQIGESADILSKGKLRSTLHCVCKPEKLDDVSRETFVVFLQPNWSQTFSVSEYTMEHLRSYSLQSQLSDKDEVPNPDIEKIVPPLSSRVRDGMTFAEFSRETTKQYYGGSGLQSKR